MKLVMLTNGKFAKVDDEDFSKVNQYKWQCVHTGRTKRPYALRSMRLGVNRRKTQQMHRFVMGVNQAIDHKNGDSLDNQKSNLRLATPVENGRNRKIQKHSTPFKGVHLFKANGTYTAAVQVDKKKVHLGYFDTPEEAAKAYDTAAIKHYGEFARTNQQMGAL